MEADYEAVLGRTGPSVTSAERALNVSIFGKAAEADAPADQQAVSGDASKQIKGDPFSALAGGEFVPPRFNPQVWATAMEQSTRLSRCIRTYARNTVGLGWFIEPIVAIGPDTEPEIKRKIQSQMERLRILFERPNPEMPTSQLFFALKVDEEATGNGYLEVVRNMKNEIVSIYHVPSVSMRIRVKKGNDKTPVIGGYIQIRGSEKRYFKEFGDPLQMDAKTGQYGDNIPLERRASEILHFKLYSPTSTWYGAPRYVSTAPAISGNRLAAIRNVSFFENDAVPRMALLVAGGRLTPESVQKLEEFFKAKVQGVEKAGALVVVQTEPTSTGFQQNRERVRLDLKPLTVGVTEDASFNQYRSANDEEIREVFGISQAFFAAESVNKASAQVQREITNEQIFEPDRLEKEYIINQKLIPGILGEVPLVRFRFERMKLTDPLDTARMDQTYASLGALTPNELRQSIGKPPYPSDYKFADKPMQVAMAELSMQLAEAIIGEWKSQIEHQKEQTQAQQEAAASGMGGMLGGGEAGEAAPGGAEEEALPASDNIEDWEKPVDAREEQREEEPEGTEAIALQALGLEGGSVHNKSKVDLNQALVLARSLMEDAKALSQTRAVLTVEADERE